MKKILLFFLLYAISFETQAQRGVGAIAASFKDSVAIRFISQAAISNYNDACAAITLTKYLRGNNLLSKMICVYPFLSNNSTGQSKNLVNTSFYNLTFYNSPNFTNNGFEPNGTSQYASTGYAFSNINNSHLSVYTPTNNVSGGFILIGSLNIVSSINNFSQINISSANGILGGINVMASFTNTNSTGYYVASRTTSANMFVQKNGATVVTNTTTNTATSPGVIFIGARNYNGSAEYFSPHIIGVATIGTDLTEAEAIKLYNCITAFRNVKSR